MGSVSTIGALADDREEQEEHAHHTCPECGSERVISDPETGEVCCGSCGIQLSQAGDLLASTFPFGDGQSAGGITLDHMPDKNLTTDFRPSDAKGGPERVKQFTNLRWLNHVVPQRNHQSVYKNVSLRLRPLLERINLPSDVVNRVVLKASRIVSEHGLLRVDGAYESLALLGLIHADKGRFLRLGRRKLIGLLSNATLRKICLVELGPPSHDGRGVREWRLSIPIEDLKEQPEGLCLVSVHLYYSLRDGRRRGTVCHLTGALPIRFMQNAALGLDNARSRLPRVVEKRKDGFQMAFWADPSACVRGRDTTVNVRVTLLGDSAQPVKKAYVLLSSGGAFFTVRKAYNMWCVLLGERTDPATIEELNEINPLIPRHLLSRVNERAHYFKRVCNRAMLQPISDRVAAALACYDVLILPAKQVGEKYEVSEGVIRAHHGRLKLHA